MSVEPGEYEVTVDRAEFTDYTAVLQISGKGFIRSLYISNKDAKLTDTLGKPERKIMQDQIKGRTFCFTGILATMKRDEACRRVIDAGGYIDKQITRRTNYLVVGIRTGGKLDKAKFNGVQILTEREFLNMLGLVTSATALPEIKPEVKKPVKSYDGPKSVMIQGPRRMIQMKNKNDDA